MKKVLFFILLCTFLEASFIKAVATPDLIIDYHDSKIYTNEHFSYQETTARLTYDKSILFFLPFGIWMEAGITLYELIYTPMLEELMQPLKVMELSKIVIKIANDEEVSDQELDFLALSTNLSFEFEYKPFRQRLDVEMFEHQTYLHIGQNVQKDITFHSYEMVKIDVLYEKGFNFFFLLPKGEKFLIINDILMPPLVFCEYNGLFYAYKIDFRNKRAILYDELLSYPTQLNRLDSQERSFFNKLTLEPKAIIEKNFREFALIYAYYLGEEYE